MGVSFLCLSRGSVVFWGQPSEEKEQLGRIIKISGESVWEAHLMFDFCFFLNSKRGAFMFCTYLTLKVVIFMLFFSFNLSGSPKEMPYSPGSRFSMTMRYELVPYFLAWNSIWPKEFDLLPENVPDSASCALLSFPFTSNLKMLMKELGSVALLAAFIIKRTSPPCFATTLDVVPGSEMRVLTFPIPVRYTEAPAFVFTTPVSLGSFTYSVFEVRRYV